MFQRHVYAIIGAVGLGLVTSCLPAPSANNNTGVQRPANSSENNSSATVLSSIGSESMTVLQNGQNVSLAQVASKSSMPFTLFQFVGVTCESCKTEAPYVSKVLSKYSGSVSRVLIFPNQADEYQTNEYLGFSGNYASGSPYLIDDSLAVIKRVRAKTTQYFGVFVLVGKDGKGLVLNADQAYLNVDSALQSVTKK